MRVPQRKTGVTWCRCLAARRSTGVVLGVVGIIALICSFACEQRAGVRPSAAGPEAKGAVEAASAAPALTNAQCVICHPQQAQTIGEHGGKHKTEVGCLDCHQEHPPQGTEAIPQCSMCHSGESHFELEQCSSCHADAHAPLNLMLEGEITEACLTCHPQQGDEVKAHPSAHTDLACNECHTAHGQIPTCMDCHEKHTEDMDFKACVSCHPAHMPLVITYSQDTPSRYCGACHEDALTLLGNSKSKHHDLSCVFCHKDKHKNTPACTMCHAEPHSKSMMDKFPKCGQCHGIAHNLRG